MTHKITEQLRALLKAYAERAAKVHADAKPVVDEGEQRRRACGERLQKVVRPVLLRFLTELENAGHDASVQDHTDSVDTYPSVARPSPPRAPGQGRSPPCSHSATIRGGASPCSGRSRCRRRGSGWSRRARTASGRSGWKP